MRLSRSLEFAAATAWLVLAPGCAALTLPQSQSQSLSVLKRASSGGGSSSVKFRSYRRTPASSPATDGQRPNYHVLAATGPTNIDLTSSQDLIYIADVSIGGQVFELQLDTGSSDMWVTGTGVPNSRSTGISLTLTYGIGYADGSIVRAPVDFAGFSIPDQALLDAIMAENPVLDLGAVGVLGLGFTSLSNVDHEANKTGAAWGRSVLYNIFAQDASVPNFITFLLSRSNDPEAPVEGSFTISETEDDYTAVTNQPKIPTWPENGPTRWNILLDSFAVNGKRFSVGTTVKGVSGSKAVILLDSGTTFTYAPDTVVDAIYRGLPGARFRSDDNRWVVPCDTRIEVTLYIGGRDYHLHPLDMVIPSTGSRNTCIGTFIPSTTALGPGEFDWLVGVNILRSFYTLYDFGDPVHNAPEGVAPHVQLLQLRTAAQANMDFFNVRGGERPPAEEEGSSNTDPEDGGSTVTEEQTTDGSGGKGNAAGGNNGGSGGNGGSSDPNANSSGVSASVLASIQRVVDYMPAILGVLGANVAIFMLLFIGGIIWVMRKRKAAARRRAAPAPLSLGGGDYKAVASTDADSMRQRGFPNPPMTPTTPGAMPEHGLIAGQAPAPQYDSSSLPIKRGLAPPRPMDAGDARHSTVY